MKSLNYHHFWLLFIFGSLIAFSAPNITHSSVKRGEVLETETESLKLNLNIATFEELVALPGVGPEIARKIVDYRSKRGGFRTIEALRFVRGIGPKKLAKIRPLVVVSAR